MFFSDKSKFLTLGIVSVFGLAAGSAILGRSGAGLKFQSWRLGRDVVPTNLIAT
jgi:hypothetical protein